MVLSPKTLRPGYLVRLATQITGNVKYDKQVIEAEYVTKDGRKKERWETEKTIHDPVEYEAAVKARGRARSIVIAVCSKSNYFGLLCLKERAEDLEKAMVEARKVADDFNATANVSRISVFIATGEIAQNDAEAMRGINAEIRGLLKDMEEGVKNLDVKVIREAADYANSGSPSKSASRH